MTKIKKVFGFDQHFWYHDFIASLKKLFYYIRLIVYKILRRLDSLETLWINSNVFRSDIKKFNFDLKGSG